MLHSPTEGLVVRLLLEVLYVYPSKRTRPSQRRTFGAVPNLRRSRVSIGFRARPWLGHSWWKSA